MLERHMNLMEEKQVILKRQQEEVGKLLQTQVGCLHGQADKQRDSQGWRNGQEDGPRGRGGGRLALGICAFGKSAAHSSLVFRVSLCTLPFCIFSGPLQVLSVVIILFPSFMGNTPLLGHGL